MTEFSLKQDEIADRVSKSRTAVTNSMRLLKLDERVQQMVIDEMLSTGHARSLLSLEDAEMQYSVAMKIFDEKTERQRNRKTGKESLNPKTKKKKEADTVSDLVYQNLEEK